MRDQVECDLRSNVRTRIDIGVLSLVPLEMQLRSCVTKYGVKTMLVPFLTGPDAMSCGP